MKTYECPECGSEIEVRPRRNYVDKNEPVPPGLETVCDFYCGGGITTASMNERAALIEHMNDTIERSRATMHKALVAWHELTTIDDKVDQ